MTTSNESYTILTSTPNNQAPEQAAALPQRHANWMSYAVAVTQQAAPASTDFSSDSDF